MAFGAGVVSAIQAAAALAAEEARQQAGSLLVAILEKAAGSVATAIPAATEAAKAYAIDLVPDTWRPLVTQIITGWQPEIEGAEHGAINEIQIGIGIALARINSIISPGTAAPAAAPAAPAPTIPATSVAVSPQ
jgi:hypothetical protein